MRLPDYLEPWRSQAEQLIIDGAIGEVTFSGPTYQIEVRDPAGYAAYVFLQFDDALHMKDIFCSCESSSENGSCMHMTVAALVVFARQQVPLHARFERSFWNQLFWQLQLRCARSEPSVRGEADRFELFSGREKLFSVQAKGASRARLKTILQDRRQEDEENSIKFSNLSEAELEEWRKGRPSAALFYELSLFGDLAKWLFLLQEAGDLPQVTLEGEPLPVQLAVNSDQMTLTTQLAPTELAALIPVLSGVQSSLAVFGEYDVAVVGMAFDPEQGVLSIEQDFSQAPRPEETAPIGPWHYLAHVGFYADVRAAAGPMVRHLAHGEEISRVLDHSLALVRKHLPHIPIEETPESVCYELFFDDDMALHIRAFLRHPGDLETPSSHFFGNWAYTDEGGFQRLEPLKFDAPHIVLPAREVPLFVSQQRFWLGQFPGFAVHAVKATGQILFAVDEDGALSFRGTLEASDTQKRQCEFGEWLWVEGEGFYLRHLTDEAQALPTSGTISKHFVADFIRRRFELLQSVPHFFATHSPIEGVGLHIALPQRGRIEIVPEYQWIDEVRGRTPIFYDEFVWVPDFGFWRLAPSLRPLHFTKVVSIQDQALWNSFFLEVLPRLKMEYPCRIDPRLERSSALALVVKTDEEVVERKEEWDLEVFWRSKIGKVTWQELSQAKKHEVRFLPTEAGLVDLSEDRFQWLDTAPVKRALPSRRKRDVPCLRAGVLDILRIQAYDTIELPSERGTRGGFYDMLERLVSMRPVSNPSYPLLNCSLRSYQRLGVEWLWFLYQHGLSGILSDDMGVGKTHQAMALMAAIHEVRPRDDEGAGRFLVICPTSLISHWQEKLAQFLPHFQVNTYVGGTRSLAGFPEACDVLLTSYGVWRNEYRRFHSFVFEVAIFDELQIAKNHISQIHRALLHVLARMKLGLTGTPIENQLRELKAVFDIVLPGYMPEEEIFRDFFVRSIERQERPERKALLSRYVRPFVLRRRKVDVLPELPEKFEEIRRCELIGEQKNLYRSVAVHQALPLIQQLKDESMAIPYMHIFSLLSSLKQICDHPAVYLKDVENYERYESGKWEMFIELLEEAEESQQKVVVFSQYLSMLDIISLHLKKRKIGYAQIRGETKLRGQEVHRFQQDASCQVFLGSLQAAGLGIDLTAASVVIHMDRWWNAARENQATDRVWRMGQQRGVQVLKMMTTGTIEEEIDLMIAKKAGYLEDIVFFDDHQVVKRFSRQDFISLLEGLRE